VNLLAFELSSAMAGAALHRDGQPVAEESRATDRSGQQVLFELIERLLIRTKLSLPEIDTFVVGRGPGNFSGLRVALTAAQALALPESKPVYAIDSGDALALQTMRTENTNRVAVLGDARRGVWWYGLFECDAASLRKTGDWALADPARLADFVPADYPCVTSDWIRLQPALINAPRPHRWICEPRFPSAGTLAELARQRIADGIPSAPLSPLYLHPPV
jgi:tRNA threonylcarbamoyl adenosine modification protein YeaZ